MSLTQQSRVAFVVNVLLARLKYMHLEVLLERHNQAAFRLTKLVLFYGETSHAVVMFDKLQRHAHLVSRETSQIRQGARGRWTTHCCQGRRCRVLCPIMCSIYHIIHAAVCPCLEQT